jgi:cytoskeletal protein CcmA (bactofilin family)
MKLKTNLIRVVLLLAVLVLPTGNAYAQDPSGDVVLFGQNYTLEEGQELNGNVAVFGGNIDVEKDARVNGDILLAGGNFQMNGDVSGDILVAGGSITISGTVDGDIAVFGGQVELTETAVVNGDIATFGGQLERDPDAQVAGNITNNQPPVDAPAIPGVPEVPNVPDVPEIDFYVNPFWTVLQILGWALLMGCLAAFLTLFLDQQIRRVGNYAVTETLIAGSIGLLSVFIGLLLILTLAPIFIIAIAWFLGVIAIGQEVGDRFTKTINQTWATPLSAGFGTFILVLIGGLINTMVPCFGWLFNFVVALIGIGAVIMTRFGSRSGTTPTAITAEPVPPAGSAD